ncbi:MAG: GntR family transcriptional regulator/MocR family aminotransferase, partial [Mariniblastus sp.]
MGKSSSSLELGFIRLNRRKKLPLATQLYDEISRAILEGQLAKGFRLPSTRGLAADLGVSRTTVINAFDQLAAEGYLTGTVGKGTFVSDQLPEEHQMVHFQSPTPQTNPKCAPTKSGTTSISLLASHNATGSKPRKNTWQSKSYGAAIESNDIPLPNDLENLTPFTPGVPALDKFPLEVWARLVRRQWKKIKPDDLSYGSPSGYEPLRQAIAEYVQAFRGVKCEVEQVFIVAGTQQA